MDNRQFLKFSAAALGYYLACLIVVDSLGSPLTAPWWIATAIIVVYTVLDLSSHVIEVAKLGTGPILRDIAWSSVRSVKLPEGVEFGSGRMVQALEASLDHVEITQVGGGHDYPLHLRGQERHRGRVRIRVEESTTGSRMTISMSPRLFKVTDDGRRLRLAIDIEAAVVAAVGLNQPTSN